MTWLLRSLAIAVFLVFCACGDPGHFIDVGPIADLGVESRDATVVDTMVSDTGTSTSADGG